MTPWSRMVLNDIVTTTQPMIDTSSMESFRTLRDAASSLEASSLRWRKSSRAAHANKHMSRIGKSTAKPAYKMKAMSELTSPWPVHWMSAPMHCQTPTFIRSSSGRFSESMMLFMALSSGWTSYIRSMSKYSDMLGRARPYAMKAPKGTTNATVASTQCRGNGGASSAGASAGSAGASGGSGTRMPKEETVEPTQNTQKHVKPMFKSM
mmetsp:Transcript_38585/g.116641  ORF Transcript_38585/g.116641 Transcript_38585/m.116641 type:complete len:208 (-) Transcript_38585:162-785(-)